MPDSPDSGQIAAPLAEGYSPERAIAWKSRTVFARLARSGWQEAIKGLHRFASRWQGGPSLRKGLFAIVLVAASFAGGATVNGPGLRWVRDMILNQPGAEITTTTLGDPAP